MIESCGIARNFFLGIKIWASGGLKSPNPNAVQGGNYRCGREDQVVRISAIESYGIKCF